MMPTNLDSQGFIVATTRLQAYATRVSANRQARARGSDYVRPGALALAQALVSRSCRLLRGEGKWLELAPAVRLELFEERRAERVAADGEQRFDA